MVVDLFFVLSGFVFYWLYAESIANRSVTPWRFAVLRCSRLYPLHLATLVAVALLTFLYKKQTGGPFGYPCNDAYHFVLQLAFASEWGFQAGHSLNGPIWSVSIEVLLYAMFFLACALRCDGPWSAAALSLLGLAVYTINGPIGRGMFGFFVGGLTFFAARFLVRRDEGRRFPRVLVACCAAAWVLLTLSVKVSLLSQITAWLQAVAPAQIPDRTIVALCSHAVKKSIVGGLFPLTILTLVIVESRRGTLGRRLSVLGEVSYFSYLLHFPLQLLVVTIFAYLQWSTEVFRHGWTIVAFYLFLVPLSILVFRVYERPAQNAIRRALCPPTATKQFV